MEQNLLLGNFKVVGLCMAEVWLLDGYVGIYCIGTWVLDLTLEEVTFCWFQTVGCGGCGGCGGCAGCAGCGFS